jgi:hypothetical protein
LECWGDRRGRSQKKMENILKTKITISKIFLTIFISIFLISLVSGITIKDVRTEPQEIAPGQKARITIEIENMLNDDIENLNIELDFSSPSLPLAPFGGSSEDSIDRLDEGDEQTFSFGIIANPDASAGVYKIPVKIKYSFKGETERFEKTGVISVLVNSPPKIKTSVEGFLIKGQENSITIKIINEGLVDLKAVSVQLQSPTTGTINSPALEFLGTIDKDDFDTIDVNIFTPKTTQSTISIPIKISFKDATNKDLEENRVITVRVYSEDEAIDLGLRKRSSKTLLVIIIILVLVFIAYRINRYRKKNKNKFK